MKSFGTENGRQHSGWSLNRLQQRFVTQIARAAMNLKIKKVIMKRNWTSAYVCNCRESSRNESSSCSLKERCSWVVLSMKMKEMGAKQIGENKALLKAGTSLKILERYKSEGK